MAKRWFGTGLIRQHQTLLVRAFCLGWLCLARVFAADATTPNWQPAQLFPHETVWVSHNDRGEVVGKFVELQSGLNRQLPDGTWTRSVDDIDIIEGGAITRGAQFTAKFGATSDSVNGVAEITLPDAAGRLRVRCVGLAYTASNGDSVFIAEIRNVQGQRFGRNQIVYENCFTGGVKADLRYTVKVGSIAQDVVLRSQLPPPQDFGLPDAKLEIWTEFLEAPEPRKIAVQTVTASGQQFTDCVLDFGPMQIGSGRAGAMDEQGNLKLDRSTRVNKQFESFDGVRFLIESTPLDEITPNLQDLPPYQRASVDRKDLNERLTAYARTSSRRKPMSALVRAAERSPTGGNSIMQVALNDIKPSAGFIVDFDLVSSSTNYTFYSDRTYYVSGTANLSATTTFEGGTVIKYAPTNNAQLAIKNGSILCKSAPYRPIFLVARDDNSVGETITNAPLSGYYGNPALFFDQTADTNVLLKEFRMSHANWGILVWGSSSNSDFHISHGQFVNCNVPVYHSNERSSGKLTMRNVLFSKCPYPITAHNSTVSGEHLTVHDATRFLWTVTDTVASYAFTNSLFIDVDSFGPPSFTSVSNYTNQTADGVFEAAAAGGHYLSTNSLRNAGTTNINAELAAELAKRTTYAPAILTNVINVATTLTNHAAWLDTDTPDLGYHYSPMDYLVDTTTVTNCTLTITNGAVLGLYNTYNFHLRDQSHVVCIGTPTAPNRFCDYYLVQENSTFYGNTNYQRFTFYPQQDSTNFLTDIRLRFSEFYGWSRHHVYEHSWLYADSIDVRDCYFNRGAVLMIQPNSSAATAHLFNNVFDRGVVWVDSTNGFTLYHNLHYGGWLVFSNRVDNTLIVKDCIFKDIAGFSSSSLSNSHNGYINCPSQLSPLATNNVSISSFTFTNGPLGAFYQHGDDFKDKGSRNATNAGLFHYTTKVSQAKETNSLVDIGPHYIAIDNTTGLPSDNDGDGTADYLEDPNGNGGWDTGENRWTSDDPDYDGMPTYQEVYDGTNPLDANDVVWRQLGYWKFDSTSFLGESLYGRPAQVPWVNSSMGNPAGWNGNTASYTGTQASPVGILGYWDVETNLWPNINLRNGTVRFWFKPNWSSGSGPTAPTFIEVGYSGSGEPNGKWLLGLTDNGSTLLLKSEQPIYQQNNKFPVSLTAGRWYQFTLTYSPTNIAAYLNGAIVGIGTVQPNNGNDTSEVFRSAGYGVYDWPREQHRKVGMGVGSAPPAWNTARFTDGQIDQLETFNYQLSPVQVARDFPDFRVLPSATMTDTDYDGRSDLLEQYVDGTSGSGTVNARLAYFRFNDSNYTGEQGQTPIATNGISQTSSWSGNCVSLWTTSTANLTYRDVETNGWANFNAKLGSVRFWFRPTWSNGPPALASFLYMGDAGARWQLRFEGSGNNYIRLITAGSGSPETNFTASYNFDSSKWHQIVVTYGSGGASVSKLYINGVAVVTNGFGVSVWPPTDSRTNGFVIGNKTGGGEPIIGSVEELETFNYELTGTEVADNFAIHSAVDSDLNGTPDIVENIPLSAAQPFAGFATPVTGVVEAEQFDKGGYNKGYYHTASNPATDYRATQMSITAVTDDIGGGYCLDNLRKDEWAVYSVDVREARAYAIEPRIAGIGTGGSFKIQFIQSNAVVADTGPIVVTTTGWSNAVATNILLPFGYCTMKVLMLTNGLISGADSGGVAKLNYITVYPWWQPGVTDIVHTNLIATASLSSGTNWADALHNSAAIQQALDAMKSYPESEGARVIIPPGEWYVTQPNPNETLGAWTNAALHFPRGNLELRGSSKTNTTLVAYNRATTIVYIGGRDVEPALHFKTNVALAELTLEARPHWVFTNSVATGPTNIWEMGGFLAPLNGWAWGDGSLVVVSGEQSAIPDKRSQNILIENCRFKNAQIAITAQILVTEMLVRSNDFLLWHGTNGFYKGEMNSPYSVRTAPYWGGTGAQILGSATDLTADGVATANRSLMVVENTFQGNASVTSTLTNVQTLAHDGLVWFYGGGNHFIGRNCITNYFLEAVQFNGGPCAIVQNRFKTYIHNGSTCALHNSVNWAPLNLPSGGEVRDHGSTFVGNDIDGGRWVALSWDSHVPNFVTVSGNTARLESPFDLRDDTSGGFTALEYCNDLNLSGNTLSDGYMAARILSTNKNLLILKNDFGGAAQGGIFFDGSVVTELPGSFEGPLGQATIAKNLITRGRTFHIRSRAISDGPRIYSIDNSFRSPPTGTTNISSVSDPIALPIHLQN